MMALFDRLGAAGSKVKSLCAEPGVAKTELAGNLARGHLEVGVDLTSFATGTKGRFPGVQSAADGACPLMEAAFGADANSGDFFMPGDFIENTVVGMPVKCITAGVATPTAENIATRFEHERLSLDLANRALPA